MNQAAKTMNLLVSAHSAFPTAHGMIVIGMTSASDLSIRADDSAGEVRVNAIICVQPQRDNKVPARYATFIPGAFQAVRRVVLHCMVDKEEIILPIRLSAPADLTPGQIDAMQKEFAPLLSEVLARIQTWRTRPIAPPERPRALAGSFDGITNDLVHGWCWDALDLEQRLTVEVLDGEELAVVATSDQLRADLKSAAMGDGRYGFFIPVPLSLRDGETHAISVRIKDTEFVLAGGARTYRSAPLMLNHVDPLRLDQLQSMWRNHFGPKQAIPAALIDAAMLLQKAEIRQCQDALTALLEELGPNPVVVCLLAQAKLLDHSDEQALEYFQQCLRMSPCMTEAIAGIGSYHARSADWSAAAAEFQRALLINPACPRLRKRHRHAVMQALERRIADMLPAHGPDAAIGVATEMAISYPDYEEVADRLAALLVQRYPTAQVHSSIVNDLERELLLYGHLSQLAEESK